jgi:hypothetical protein
MKLLHFFNFCGYLLLFAFLDPDPEPTDQNQCGSMQIQIHNTIIFFSFCTNILLTSAAGKGFRMGLLVRLLNAVAGTAPVRFPVSSSRFPACNPAHPPPPRFDLGKKPRVFPKWHRGSESNLGCLNRGKHSWINYF